jgi:hypothetical protein
LTDCVKILLAKQLKNKMTLLYLKLKGISIVLMILEYFNNTRLVSKEKEMVKMHFKK